MPSSDRAVQLEILKPSFDDGEYTFTTFAVFLSGRFPVGDNFVLVGELPFATAGVDFDGFDESESVTGNIYLGGEFGGTDSPVFGELGVRLPLTKDADYFGAEFIFMDGLNRWEAFLHEIMTLHAAFNYRYIGPTGLVLGFRLAPALWIDTGDQLADDVELFALYGAHAGYEGANLAVRGGFSGRAHITEEYADDGLGRRTLHQLVLAGSFGLGRWWPGVQIHLPLDEDMTELIDLVFGLTLAVQLP